MLYDFHIHTRNYSDCAVSSAEEICLKAVEAGLAGIALTEHDVWWPLADIQELQRKFPKLSIMRGIEYTCPEGHFLVYLPDPETDKLPGWRSVSNLLPLVHDHGGIVIWAHPFRFSKTMPNWLEQVQPDGMEIASSNMHRRAESMATKVAMEIGAITFHNSDAHHSGVIGDYANDLDLSLTSVEDFISYVRKRTSTPISKDVGSTVGFGGLQFTADN